MNLEAYRQARLDEARAAARHVEAEAEASLRQRLDDARLAAEAILAGARAEAAAEAEREDRTAMARERRRARRIVLEARRAVYQDLTARVRAGAVELRADAAYDKLLDGLERLARRRLGESAVVVRDPDPGGGLVAEAGGRRVDYTLPTLADRCVGALGAEVERLWR